ncbi:hypothetical protein D3C80_2037700 [compost metagenome]
MLFLHTRTGAFALRRGMLQRRTCRLLFGIPLALIVSVVAAIYAQPGSAEFQNARHLRQ